jgi:hypothetical protein
VTAVVGAVTIGQSPRGDVVPELLVLLPGVDCVETGALDGESPRRSRRSRAPRRARSS